jgi:hypothetical protein
MICIWYFGAEMPSQELRIADCELRNYACSINSARKCGLRIAEVTACSINSQSAIARRFDTSMGEGFLSRKESTIVARHEVPG